MRSTLGMYGMALASLASLASAAVELNSADADLSLNPDFSLEGTTAGDNYGTVRSALDSRGHEGAVFIFDKRNRPGTATVDVYNDKFLEVDVPISWPTGATVGAQFGINVEFLVSDVDSHYLTPPVTSSDIETGCNMHILATWGPESVPRPGAANQPAFPRELWYGTDLLPRSTVTEGQYDTRYGASVGLPLTIPENFANSAQNLIVHVRQVCATLDTGTLPKVNDFMLTRVQAYLVNEVSEPVTTTSTTSSTSATEEPVPTTTDEPVQTTTDEPVPTGTDEPIPTGTDEPIPTGTDEPIPTGTDGPVPTETTDGPVTTGEPTGTPTGGDNTTSPTTTAGPVPTGDAVLPGPVRVGDYKYSGCASSPPPSAGTSPFVLAATRADNSIDVCIGICQTQNKTLSGTSGADCYCGNGDASTLSTVGDASCDIPCPGNPAQSCGGRLLLGKRYLQARQAPPFGVLLTVYVFAPAVDATTTIALPSPTGSGTTINNINNINNTNTNVNNVNISIMIPVTCLPGACETEVYYERVCEVCKPEEPAWRPIKCAGDACVNKPVCRPEPAPKCVDDCWVEAPCTSCDGGVVYKPQAQAQAAAPEHPAVLPADKTTSAPLPIYTAGARAIAANMGSLVAVLAPMALVFFA